MRVILGDPISGYVRKRVFQRLRAVKNDQVYSFDYEGVASFGWALTFLEQFQPIAEAIRAKF
ncbi:hypothetical protein [Rhodococcus erythropolis]|uniref:hypothetical protein n=1 Tax=Rhodococcus erythropolis TaxID=1833 RepID=UPI002034FFAF|nr:hypothetical protein [Rhodococcus erythropolis]